GASQTLCGGRHGLHDRACGGRARAGQRLLSPLRPGSRGRGAPVRRRRIGRHRDRLDRLEPGDHHHVPRPAQQFQRGAHLPDGLVQPAALEPSGRLADPGRRTRRGRRARAVLQQRLADHRSAVARLHLGRALGPAVEDGQLQQRRAGLWPFLQDRK
ncbi:MAG: hypothetical protein AVDCRST_MAG90-998, partial [uncultured Microvirga sp.]